MTPPRKSVVSPRRARNRHDQIKKGNGKNQPVNLVAAAQPRTRPKARPSAHHGPPWRCRIGVGRNGGLGKQHDRQDPERCQNGVVRRVMSVSKQIGLKDPGTSRGGGGPLAPS